ncbi:uncharacterized protein LOC128878759 [Hylaeus volcanicus]|uniref:uncharacterized protein LOC128878759 n=1 Tax=Hylaeus volcanicus TaxID=313075 RepID=UPI0023B7F892|nr:uncharacterized protein LOC128878759 [Hylaeus volcanicus]
MATTLARAIRSLSTAYRSTFRRENPFDLSNVVYLVVREPPPKAIGGKARKAWLGIVAGIVVGCGGVCYFLDESVKAHTATISLPRYPWEFKRVLKSFDHAAVRRGWQVYRTVCYTCHSLRYVRFLDLIDVTHTKEEVKAIAKEFEVDDGPDEGGNYYKRPAKLSDRIPSPFPNEEAARAANFGAYPPDLSQLIYARKHGTDYMFSLLTGWYEPPAGVRLGEGQQFNVYFPGGIITMAPMFFEGCVEYDDGVPATESQMAKDVVEFLLWTASPEHDTRKIMTLKSIGIFLMLLITIGHIVRRHGSHMTSRRIAYVPKRTC